jgi:hypothetical protein
MMTLRAPSREVALEEALVALKRANRIVVALDRRRDPRRLRRHGVRASEDSDVGE